MKPLFENWRGYLEEQKRPPRNINIKNYGPMEINDYYLIIGLANATHPNEGSWPKKQKVMEVFYNLIHKAEMAPAWKAGIRKLIEDSKKTLKNEEKQIAKNKRNTLFIEKGKSVTIVAETVYSRQRIEKAGPGGGTKSMERTYYKWERRSAKKAPPKQKKGYKKVFFAYKNLTPEQKKAFDGCIKIKLKAFGNKEGALTDASEWCKRKYIELQTKRKQQKKAAQKPK